MRMSSSSSCQAIFLFGISVIVFSGWLRLPFLFPYKADDLPRVNLVNARALGGKRPDASIGVVDETILLQVGSGPHDSVLKLRYSSFLRIVQEFELFGRNSEIFSNLVVDLIVSS